MIQLRTGRRAANGRQLQLSIARRQESAARASVSLRRLIIIFFLLLLAEGVLRKWFLSPIQAPLIFIREPVLILIYVRYLMANDLRPPPWFKAWLAVTVLFTMFGLLQVVMGHIPLIVAVVGVRNYMLYIPLAFIMAERADGETLRRLLMWVLCLSVPIAILVTAQYKLPPSSFLNKGTSDDIKGILLVADNIVRPYGPFTYAQAQNTYAVLTLAMVLIGWEGKSKYRLPVPLLVIASSCAFVMGALSGGRTFFGGALLVGFTFALAALTSKRASAGALRLGLLGLTAMSFIGVFVLVFPSSFSAMSARQTRSESQEGSTVERGFSMVTSVTSVIDQAPLLGVGMGLGSNVGATLAAGGGFGGAWTLGEYDWPRTIQELGPIVGILYLTFRCVVFLWLAIAALAANRKHGDSAALIMFGFSGYIILAAQLVGQSQMLSFGWFSAGLTAALAVTAGNAVVGKRAKLRDVTGRVS